MKTSISNSFKALLGVALLAVSVNALPKISVSGRYLYDESGNRFYIKGVGYQPQGGGSVGAFGEPTDFIDPLSSGANCTRDIPHLKDLGVNTVRVYSVNFTLNHDDCMKGLSAAGIYTIIDLSLPQSSITRDTPAWSTDLQNTYLSTVQAFSGYDNVLAYNVGNEVVIATNGTAAATFIKAAARDTKAFIKAEGSSALVGYAAIDGESTLIDPLASYLACDPSGQNSGAAAIDIYGTNNYRWSGDSTFQKAWAASHGDFAGLNIPAYLSEYGQVPAGGVRQWQEVGSLFSTDMSDVFSGGVAFNYFPAQSADGQFGMVTISSDGSSVTTSQDFSNLQAAYGKATGPTSPSKSDAGTTAYPSCPQSNSTFSASTTLPPTPNVDACNCLEKASPCQFKAKTNNETQTAIDIGSLLNYGCTALGQNGLNCDDIAADGITGKYGKASPCSPDIKLSYVFSLFYENQKQNDQACNFGGAAVINAAASKSFPSGPAESCVASATGTAVPVLPSSSGSGSSTRTNSAGSSTSTSDAGSSGALALTPSGGVLGMSLMAVLGLVGGAVVLA